MSINTLIATTGPGIARASYITTNWSVQFLLNDQDVRCLAADPIRSEVVYAGTQGQGVLRSDDRGRTWQSAGLHGRIIKALAVSPAEPGTIYAGTKPALLFVSRDDGVTWTELTGFRRIRSRWFWFSPAEPPFSAYVQAIGLSPVDPRVIVVGIEAGAVVRSEDGGQNWTGHCLGAVRDCHSLNFHVSNGQWVYEGGGTGAAFSQDAGRTWKQPRDGLDRHYGWACTADPEQPNIWYVSASPLFLLTNPGPPPAHIDGKAHACIFRSVGGARWQKLSGGLPQPMNFMPYALLTNPTAPGHVYAGLSNGDVWHSVDHGDSWQKLPVNLRSIRRAMILL